MADVLDTDDPVLRGVLARLCQSLSAILMHAADDLVDGASMTPWQAVAVAARLDRLRQDAEFLRKDVARLIVTADED